VNAPFYSARRDVHNIWEIKRDTNMGVNVIRWVINRDEKMLFGLRMRIKLNSINTNVIV